MFCMGSSGSWAIFDASNRILGKVLGNRDQIMVRVMWQEMEDPAISLFQGTHNSLGETHHNVFLGEESSGLNSERQRSIMSLFPL